MVVLSDVAQVIAGLPVVAAQGDFSDEALRLIGIRALTDDAQVDFENWDEGHGTVSSGFQVREGDVLLTSRGTSLRAAIARRVPNEVFFASANLIILRADVGRVLPPILWACVTSFLQSQRERQVSRQSVGQVSLPIKEVRALRFRLPPLHEQHALAAAIDSMLLAHAAARAVADQQGSVLRTFISAQFRPLF
jgi:hypothetical protein